MQTNIEHKLASMGLVLPTPPGAVASYVPARRHGDLLYISGQLPFLDGQLMATGIVPSQVDPDTAKACARQCALNAMAVAKGAVGTLDAIAGVVRVGCFVASEPGFGGQPMIANGASDLLVEIFGEDGRHARAAVGSIALPLNATVEVEVLFALRV